jgi:predicted Zn-dependent peptidase
LNSPAATAPPILTHRYPSGLTLLVEPMAGVASVGMTLLTPAGAAAEPESEQGVAGILAEMIFRGAGDLDSRAHSDALDRLGVHRSSDVYTQHMRLGATMMGDCTAEALPLLLDCVTRPHLADDAFDPSRQLAIASIEALEDDPQHKAMIELKRQHVGEPIGRSTMGRIDHLEAMSAEQVRAFYTQRCVGGGSILALAGCVNFEAVRDQVGLLLEGFGGVAEEIADNALPPRRYCHMPADSAQQHIGVAYDTIGELDPANMTQRVAMAVLSGGMSGRLFTEVRENRGLCYSVYATYGAQRQRGFVYGYAGTTPQRADETLEVMTGELRRLSDGVEADEFDRAIVGLKSRVVMQGESTSARASALASDQFMRGKARTLDDLAAEIDAVTFDKLNDFLAAHRPGEMTTLNIGPEPLKEV